MNITFREHALNLKSWQNKHEMVDALKSCEAGSLLLGEGTEEENEFHSVIVHIGPSKLRSFGVGVISQGHGLHPSLLLKAENSVLIIGFNREVTGICLPEGIVAFEIHLDWLFQSFLPLFEQNLILVLYEIGV